MIDIRHYLNDYLLRIGGNIGYSVRASERRKGYAKEMLRLALLKCRKLDLEKVLITCFKHNIASAKTIIANGGILENEITDEDGITQRYWIFTTK
jgi:predicted acetyltransferase